VDGWYDLCEAVGRMGGEGKNMPEPGGVARAGRAKPPTRAARATRLVMGVMLGAGLLRAGPPPARAAPPPPPPPPAPAPADRLLVLPLRGSGVTLQDAKLLEARLLVELTRAGAFARTLDEALAAADQPRSAVPARLLRCGSRRCLRQLADLGGATRLLAIELVPAQAGLSVFATVYGWDGVPAGRQEFRVSAAAALPDEVPAPLAAWIARGALAEATPQKPPPAALPPGRARLAWVLPAGDATASALAAAFGAHLVGSRVDVGQRAATHRAVISDVALELGRVRHHIRHYLDGTLSATLTISDAAGTTVYTRRASASYSKRFRYTSVTAAEAALVADVARRWLGHYVRELTEDTLTRRKP